MRRLLRLFEQSVRQAHPQKCKEDICRGLRHLVSWRVRILRPHCSPGGNADHNRDVLRKGSARRQRDSAHGFHRLLLPWPRSRICSRNLLPVGRAEPKFSPYLQVGFVGTRAPGPTGARIGALGSSPGPTPRAQIKMKNWGRGRAKRQESVGSTLGNHVASFPAPREPGLPQIANQGPIVLLEPFRDESGRKLGSEDVEVS